MNERTWLEAEQASALLSVGIDNEGRHEEADRNTDRNLDHAHTEASNRRVRDARSLGAVSRSVEVVSDFVGVLQARQERTT